MFVLLFTTQENITQSSQEQQCSRSLRTPMHDNTLTNSNRDKLIQIAERYGHPLKFYNVEELCTDRIKKIKEFFPNVGVDRHSIAMFYRLFIPYLLLPQDIQKAIYLDSDIIFKLDITELWQIELADKPFGAIPEVWQFKDIQDGINTKRKSIMICGEDVVDVEDYFNSGVLLMNLKVLHDQEDTLMTGMKFISENPQFDFLDQDILNYCFSTTYLKLPIKFNRFVLYARRENDWTIQENIYHYAASRMCFVMDSRDVYNQLFMSYFIKTPWVDADMLAALSGTFSSQKKYPISVIIPLYNEEDYIGECLDCLLAQTFQAFEIVVVDDCSTDNSVAVVEDYMPRFNGRLKLAQTEKNSGGGGYVPRNIGLKLARGEYVYILDADDLILTTALETFYTSAILYDAEVVYTKSCYFVNAPNSISLYRDFITRKSPRINTEFTIGNTNNNLSRLFSSDGRGEFNTIQTTFCQREFLLANKLFFPQITRTGDFLWVVSVYCHVNRFLRISTPLCLRRRYNDNSITRTVRSPQEQCSFWLGGLAEFAKSLNELKRENKILNENPIYDLTILKKNLLWSLDRTEYARKELGSEELFKVLLSDFTKEFSNSSASLLSLFLSFIDNEIRMNEYYSGIFNKFKNYFTARIDIKLMSAESDFQIVSISDDKAKIENPKWFQKDGIGYIIHSCTGSLKFAVKSSMNGKLWLNLKAMDIRKDGDRTKRIPYFIDYTKLIVNDKLIFDKIVPAWHNKNYNYYLNVKADEEIKIQVEWLPHRADSIEQKPSKVTAPKSKVETPPSKSNTARLDIKMTPETANGDFQIVSISDNKASVNKPAWAQNNGIGYAIQSCDGKLEFVVKGTESGRFNLNLRGLWVPQPDNKSKHIPYWIDYTKLIVNGETIFDTVTPAWFDKPYSYKLDAKADEEIKIQVEWLPHKGDT